MGASLREGDHDLGSCRVSKAFGQPPSSCLRVTLLPAWPRRAMGFTGHRDKVPQVTHVFPGSPWRVTWSIGSSTAPRRVQPAANARTDIWLTRYESPHYLSWPPQLGNTAFITESPAVQRGPERKQQDPPEGPSLGPSGPPRTVHRPGGSHERRLSVEQHVNYSCPRGRRALFPQAPSFPAPPPWHRCLLQAQPTGSTGTAVTAN